MIDSQTEYHLRIYHGDSELLHSRSESPFMVPRVGELVRIDRQGYRVASVIHQLVQDSSDNLIHDCQILVELHEFRVHE
jgi:hypothetical protein